MPQKFKTGFQRGVKIENLRRPTYQAFFARIQNLTST